jgi:hypothetical protein
MSQTTAVNRHLDNPSPSLQSRMHPMETSMTVADSLLLFKFVLAGGLALWLTLGFFNNVMAFEPASPQSAGS